jgi:prepilin-type N-terminal cleavage/methylation domain-containing protein
MKNNRGYTIIEISIVLSIIAMIMGAVVIGNSMVNTAKNRTTLKEVQNIITATAIFKDKYNQLPGDMDNASTAFGHTDVNGNGITDGAGSGVIAGTNTLVQGVYSAFQELALAGLITGVYTGQKDGSSSSGITIGKNVMGSIYNTNAAYWFYSGNLSSRYDYGNSLVISGTTGSFGYDTPVISVNDAYYMDNKADDGAPYTGKIIAYNLIASNCVNTTISGSLAHLSQYNYLNDNSHCVMHFALDNYIFKPTANYQ